MPTQRSLILGVDSSNVTKPIKVNSGGGLNFGDMSVPAGAPVVGQAKVSVTGTAVAFSGTSKPLTGKTVMVTANLANAGAVTVGGSSVNNTVDGTGNGLIIAAGETAMVFVNDVKDLYLNGTAGDLISYSAI